MKVGKLGKVILYPSSYGAPDTTAKEYLPSATIIQNGLVDDESGVSYDGVLDYVEAACVAYYKMLEDETEKNVININ